jgi:y4mF family transcriptional regulator
MTDCVSIGSIIRQERKKQQLTQSQLAGLAGVGVRFLREVERGKPSCQLGLTLQVAQTLGLSIHVSSRDGRLS